MKPIDLIAGDEEFGEDRDVGVGMLGEWARIR